MELPLFSKYYEDYVSYYRHLIDTKSDSRTSQWFLMESPAPVLGLIGLYFFFSTFAGPRFMKPKKPFELKAILIVYNFVQVVLSVVLVHEGLVSGWAAGYSFTCQPVDYSDAPKALRMAASVWLYFMCKLLELLDTVFFVLRKKQNQVTFLHLYHHGMMPVCAWVGVKFLAGGHGTLMGLINSFIHILMYSYYLLASMGPGLRKYLWWKRHLTLLQMAQFCIVLVHNLQVLPRACNYPKEIVVVLAAQTVLFLVLFSRFYYVVYVKAPRKIKNGVENYGNCKIKIN